MPCSSGALTSGLGYVVWYRVLQHLRAMTAFDGAALAGIVLLGEALTRDLLLASLLILGGIWLVLRRGKA